MSAKMPAIFLSHGAPPLADDETWTRELAEWSAKLPRPQSILMVSAHWEDEPLTIGATTTVPLTYDFYGSPAHYYQVRYEAPGAPQLAAEVTATDRIDRCVDSRCTDEGTRSRCLRPAERDVSQRGHPSGADSDAIAGPANAVRCRPYSRCAARRRGAHHGEWFHDAQSASG